MLDLKNFSIINFERNFEYPWTTMDHERLHDFNAYDARTGAVLYECSTRPNDSLCPYAGRIARPPTGITKLKDSNGGIKEFHSFLTYFFS